jgi:putative addiction module component (TIGR02574 family)
MPRQLRREYAGAIYPVLIRGDHREAIFRGAADRKVRLFLAALTEVCGKTRRQLARMKTCQNARQGRYLGRMNIAAETMAEVLALPEKDRAYLARQLIASLDDAVDADAEEQWNEVIDRRSREMAAGPVAARSEEEVIADIRHKLHARRQTSSKMLSVSPVLSVFIL